MNDQTTTRNPPTRDIRCGTYAGYQRHQRLNETSCTPCRDANTAYHREWIERNSQAAEAERLRQLARTRATQRLIAAHRDQWRALVIDEMRQM